MSLSNIMNQSLNLMRDLDFTEMVDRTESQIVTGGLKIGFPIDGDWGGCFPKPRPPVHPPLPLHPPIGEFPKPRPHPKPPIIICYAPTMPMTH